MSSRFDSTIICQLVEDALPTPEFLWNITVNGTEFISTFTNNFYYENDSLRLIGPINLDHTSTLDIVCHVSNLFGDDTMTTSINLCGKFMHARITVMYTESLRVFIAHGGCKSSSRNVLLYAPKLMAIILFECFKEKPGILPS